jgi:hypothetical protein
MAKVEHDVHGLEGQEVEVAHPADSGPAVFRACRDAIRQMLTEVLPALIQCYAVEEGRWDEFVPAGLVERIVAEGAASGGSYACEPWMHVEVTRELLPLREDGGARAGEACPICMEELADGVTGLPGCSHAFHRECILEWFCKAWTCPCCRRDIGNVCIVNE